MAEKASVYFKKVSEKLDRNVPKAKDDILKDMARKSDENVPEDTGKTRIEMKVDRKRYNITWSNPYVEFIYFGVHLKFQKTHNLKAKAMWADFAIQQNIDKWANMYADAIIDAF
ncbi:MAG: hypothetical protein KAX49_07235 [Halanaerobiales bacterium]|nr:hypothetical protein [Halanaerobiales bacterium]